MTNDEALELLQSKIAFLEQANSELSDVLIRQQREIQTLAARLKQVMDRLDTLQAASGELAPQDERPPHY
jgi:SlyX protein